MSMELVQGIYKANKGRDNGIKKQLKELLNVQK
jgi:hypothetical protein